MLCPKYDKILVKAYQLLKISSLPQAACYAPCIIFPQHLAFRPGVKIFSIDTRVSLFPLIAVVDAKNPLFRQVYFFPL